MNRIIVAGSEGLIGREVSRYLEMRGNRVIRCDISLGDDLSDELYVRRWFKKNKAQALVNLFALNDHVDSKKGAASLFSISLESFEAYLKVNLTSLFSVCREFARNNKGGAIVNFSSTYGMVSPVPSLYPTGEKHIGYSVSKAGVVQLTRHLAVHLAPRFRVNCIVPGGVKHRQGGAFARAYGARTPMGRMMNVGELNGIVEFLCSDASSYASGAAFTIDGGWTAW